MIRNSRRGGSSESRANNPTSNNDRSTQATYGYHNTFHTHATPSTTESAPPNYDIATSSKPHCRPTKSRQRSATDDVLPGYTCSIQLEGALAVKCELATPFVESGDRKWHEIYAVLRGTQLSIYRLKTGSLLASSRHKALNIGRLIKSYTLQHAEVGLAVDFKKGDLVPRSTFAKLMPAAARQRLYETDPSLFEPRREWVVRLRLETEQLLLSAGSQDDMLNWVETLAAAIDISPPIEDRSEPRYRSLPRRNRRQRQIEGLLEHLGSLSDDAMGRRLIEQQARLIRRLYPHLAAQADEQEPVDAEQENEAALREHATQDRDPDVDDLDPADVTEGGRPTTSRTATNSPPPTYDESSAPQTLIPATPSSSQPLNSYDPKTATRISLQSHSSQLRYRRRCAPILLESSPRASDIVYSNGKRARIDVVRHRLVGFEMLPPRYDVGGYRGPRTTLASVLADVIEEPTINATATARTARRPTLDRGVSEVSYASRSSSWTSPEAPEADAEAETETQTHHRPDGEIRNAEESLRLRISSSGPSQHDEGADAPPSGSVSRSLDRIDSAIDSEPSTPTGTAAATGAMSKKTAMLVVRQMKNGQLEQLGAAEAPVRAHIAV